jgi:hypothetical protein
MRVFLVELLNDKNLTGGMAKIDSGTEKNENCDV